MLRPLVVFGVLLGFVAGIATSSPGFAQVQPSAPPQLAAAPDETIARAGAARPSIVTRLAALQAAAKSIPSARDGEDSPERIERLRDLTATALSTYVTMRTAAPLCADITSPDEYLHELGEVIAPLMAWLAARDLRLRQHVVALALAGEASASVLDRRDPLLCRRGLYSRKFCSEEERGAPCPKESAAFPEFVPFSADSTRQQVRGRLRALEEVKALGREQSGPPAPVQGAAAAGVPAR